MSRAFRNSIATIAAFEGFANMLCDLSEENPQFVQFRKDIRVASKQAQSFCKGVITYAQYNIIKEAILTHAGEFSAKDKLMDVVGYLSFAMIGLDNVICSFKSVKPKNRNAPKIRAFENLAKLGFQMLQLFDPNMDSVDKYEKAEFARERWEIIFGI